MGDEIAIYCLIYLRAVPKAWNAHFLSALRADSHGDCKGIFLIPNILYDVLLLQKVLGLFPALYAEISSSLLCHNGTSDLPPDYLK